MLALNSFTGKINIYVKEPNLICAYVYTRVCVSTHRHSWLFHSTLDWKHCPRQCAYLLRGEDLETHFPDANLDPSTLANCVSLGKLFNPFVLFFFLLYRIIPIGKGYYKD